MEVREEGDRLIVEYHSGRLPRAFWVLSAGMVVWTLVLWLRDRRVVHGAVAD